MPNVIQGINVEVVCRKRLRYVIVTTRVLAQPMADKNCAFCGVFTRPRPKEPLIASLPVDAPITTPFILVLTHRCACHIVTRGPEPYRSKSVAVSLSADHGYRNQLPGHRARGWALPLPQCL